MIFTSYTYVAFLLAAFILHWMVPDQFRKWLLIVLSYVFYCSWKWQYGFLLLAVSLVTFAFGSVLAKRNGSGKLLALAITFELLPLIFFKYTGFLLSNAVWLANLVPIDWHPPLPNILLPLGISFFTFQGVAYLVDIATGEKPFDRLSDFLLFKAFWPQLIAGPIIRHGEIRDQITAVRRLDYPAVADGLRRILRGFFKKAVLADTIGPIVEAVFLPGARPSAIDSGIGLVGFGLQIYFDFSAYSDIAIGTARLFGFTFPENFNLPYTARSPQEFWNRWHMTLSHWIRDYVFTPLNFSARRNPHLAYLWLVAAMAICGLWHGAQWTFVVWGVWHGILLVLGQTWLKPVFAAGTGKGHPVMGRVTAMITFALVTLAWAFFRSQTVGQAWDIISSITKFRGGLRPAVLRENAILVMVAILGGLVCFHGLAKLEDRIARWSARHGLTARVLAAGYYTALMLAIIIFDKEARAFVYFQF